MGWFGMFLIAIGAIVLIVRLLAGKQIVESGGRTWIGTLVGSVLLFIGVVITGVHSYQQIGAGKVGIEYGISGGIVGQMNGGGFIAPWNSVKQLDTRVLKAEYQNLDIFSKETIKGEADVTVNFHVNPQDAQKLIRTVGFNYAETLIHSRVQNDVKDATVQYAALELAPHREDIRKTVASHLDAELSPYSIHVDAVQVNNITLPDTITGPIADRQAAVIKAQAAENKVKQVQAEAEQRVAQAKGEADSTVVAAEGQAKANAVIAKSISTNPDYLNYLRVQALTKLAENPATKLVPSNVFLNPSDLDSTPKK